MNLRKLFFPTRCAICRKVGVGAICPACERALPFAEEPLHESADYGRCAAPLYYEGAVREALLRFKFYGGTSAAEGFGALMARCVAENLSGEFDTVTWVSVSKKRRRGRGYDQSRLLAEEMCSLWDTKPVPLLRKTVDTPAQSSLTDPVQRRGNVFGVYEIADPERVRGARILLVDDIMTTGATLGECVRVLKEGGAGSVVCAALAAPRRTDGGSEKSRKSSCKSPGKSV